MPPEAGDELVRSLVKRLDSAVVAFSGGVDSSVVLALALEELGPERVMAVTAASETYPQGELEDAAEVAASLGARHVVVETSELKIEGFSQNPTDRCFHCKRELFEKLWGVARDNGLATVVDGANADDRDDHRPGLRAAQELEVRHPLMEAGLGKEAVRSLALRLGLDNWAKPALACLSSRIPYGEAITEEKLGMIGAAESLLRGLGLSEYRVRHHAPSLARLEVPVEDLARLVEEETRGRVVDGLRRIGYTYVSLDLQGFRSGSMNEVLLDQGREA
jgi:uncharacterized protein